MIGKLNINAPKKSQREERNILGDTNENETNEFNIGSSKIWMCISPN